MFSNKQMLLFPIKGGGLFYCLALVKRRSLALAI